MKYVAPIIVWAMLTLIIFLLWRVGVWADSLFTVKTQLYWTAHYWAALIFSPVLALFIILGINK